MEPRVRAIAPCKWWPGYARETPWTRGRRGSVRRLYADQILARLTVCRGRHRLPAGRGLFQKRGIRLDDDGRHWQEAKPFRQRVLGARHGGLSGSDQFVPALEAHFGSVVTSLAAPRIGGIETALPMVFISAVIFHLRLAEVMDFLRVMDTVA